ncbi:carrier protein ymc [Thecamonas trahens ATCC 50062]|uniref:Carrier protein ymc n=1 Tax=Thecamonas trahens ATCC 50062 TaxID=461836 RepID=A0A0L0DUI4_THETB|nr:carrier protein ymc [Thecamonas trahens ATCC 50062]KNC55857.1 carrier protein ymc [Thecamonas trahens ATCC 50062]|eukprot:XP_013752782.1 carrier protein ymc [Thecamonas trahens ATCC 50062]
MAAVESDPIKDFLAGVLGGVSGVVAGQPLDTVKVRMQARPAGTYTGLLDAFQATMRKEGVAALYKGMLSPALGCAPVNAVLFVTYGYLTRAIMEPDGALAALLPGGGTEAADVAERGDANADQQLTIGAVALAGAGAGLACSMITSPIDLIKIQLQNQSAKRKTAEYRGNIATIRHIVRVGGPLAIMQGLVPSFVREIPSYALYFSSYELVKRLLLPDELSADELSATAVATATLLSGGIGGTLAWVSTYPIDVIKTKVQARDPGMVNPPSMLATARSLYAAEGHAVFFRGMSACIIRAFPANAVTFFIYELALKLMIQDESNEES